MYFLLPLPSLPQRRLVDRLTKQWFVVRQILARLPRASLPPAHHPIRATPPTTRPSGFSRAAPQGAEGQGGEETPPFAALYVATS